MKCNPPSWTWHRITVHCRIESFRGHQIRAQTAHVGHPVVSDSFYTTPSTFADDQAEEFHIKLLGHAVMGGLWAAESFFSIQGRHLHSFLISLRRRSGVNFVFTFQRSKNGVVDTKRTSFWFFNSVQRHEDQEERKHLPENIILTMI